MEGPAHKMAQKATKLLVEFAVVAFIYRPTLCYRCIRLYFLQE